MRELLNKKVIKEEDKDKIQQSLLKIFENEKLKLENEEKAFKNEKAKLDKIYNDLESACHKYQTLAAHASMTLYQSLGKLKESNNQITDL